MRGEYGVVIAIAPVDENTTFEGVVAITAIEGVSAGTPDGIIASIAVELVDAGIVVEGVVTLSAMKLVLAGASVQVVVTDIPVEDVITATA